MCWFSTENVKAQKKYFLVNLNRKATALQVQFSNKIFYLKYLDEYGYSFRASKLSTIIRCMRSTNNLL